MFVKVFFDTTFPTKPKKKWYQNLFWSFYNAGWNLRFSFLTCPFERTGYEGHSTPLKAVSFSVCMCFTSETFKTSFIRVWFDETPLSLTLLMDDLHYCRAPDPCDSTSAAANSNTAVFLCVLLTLKSTEAVKLRVLYEMRTRELIYFAVTAKSSFKVKHPNDWRPSGVSPVLPPCSCPPVTLSVCD